MTPHERRRRGDSADRQGHAFGMDRCGDADAAGVSDFGAALPDAAMARSIFIAVRGNRLAFVEVKWRATQAEAEIALRPRQIERIRQRGGLLDRATAGLSRP